MLVYINALGLMHCASDMCGCVVSRNMFMGFAFLYFSRLKSYNPMHPYTESFKPCHASCMVGWMAVMQGVVAVYGGTFYVNLIGQQIMKLRRSLDSISPCIHA